VGPVEPADFEPTVRAHAPAWRRVAFAICGDWAAADDALQVALLRTSRHWHRLRAEVVVAYARRAVVNAALDELRRPHRRHEIAVEQQDLDVRAAEPPDPAERGDVRRALLALPAAQRAVLALRYFDGCSVEETATALRVAPATVSSQSSRALAALRRTLAPARQDPNHPADSEETRS
jgi:RNA polymerase sigma factor (sigma-70 family)